MRRIFSAIAAALCALAITPSAFAGAGVITTEVTPLSTTVTYSVPGALSPPRLDTYVGYTVAISNDGGNTVNNIRFTGTTSVTDTAEKATFSSVEGATCVTTNTDLTAIECTIGQLTAGQAFPTFAVFFKAPVKLTNGVADVNGQDAVGFSGITFYAEGTGGPNSIPDNSVAEWTTAAVALGTDNPLRVKSAVPKSGGKFFTGGSAITTPNDRFTTSVDVPAAATFTTAEIIESTFSPTCTSFIECYQSQVLIPGTFSPYLMIVLRQDASNIKPGTKINSVVVQYIGDGDPPPLGWPYTVGDCASGPAARTDGLPCIAKRTYYKNRSVLGWTAALDGDFEWTLINLKNGGYKFP